MPMIVIGVGILILTALKAEKRAEKKVGVFIGCLFLVMGLMIEMGYEPRVDAW
jgi:hypothetical protein